MLFERYSRQSPVSCELRLPRKSDHPDLFADTVRALTDFNSPFASITTRPGEGAKALPFVSQVPALPVLIHLTAWGYSIGQMDELLTHLENAKVRDVLAIRGDHPLTGAGKEQLSHDIPSAHRLLSHMTKRGFNVYVACAPEGYPGKTGMEAAIDALQAKADAGAQGAISQIIFDEALLDRFLNRITQRNIRIPISIGVMAPTHPARLRNMASVNEIEVPPELGTLAETYQSDPTNGFQGVIEWAAQFIKGAIHTYPEVAGAHFFSFNEPLIVRGIFEAVRSELSPEVPAHP